MQTVNVGDKVRYFGPLGVGIGVVQTVEIRYGENYAAIRPEDGGNIKYLFHGAVEGFDLLDEVKHPWSPVAISRLRMMRGK